MKTKAQTVYHDGVDRTVIDELIATHGATLLALAGRNRSCGRSDQAFLPCDGHMLAVVTRRHATEELGVKLSETTEYAILGLPRDSKMARSIAAHIDADAGALQLDIDGL
jgi:hypothetical protein